MSDVELPSVEEVDVARVARVSRRLEIVDIRLAHCFARGPDDPAGLPADWAEGAFIGLDVLRPVTGVDGSVKIRVEFVALYFPAGHADDPRAAEDEEEPLVQVACDFVCSYAPLESAELDPEDIAHFAVADAPMHAWPCWRELAESMCLRLGIAPLRVGTWNLSSSLDPPAESSTE